MEDPVQVFCELIVKYNDNARVAAIEGITPTFQSGEPINYNLVKGIDINNSKKSIGTIYKRLARLTHSDKTQDGADDFKNLNNAVEELRGDPNGLSKVLAKLLEMQTPQTQSTMGESSATPRANFNVSSNPQYEWQFFTQRKADAAAGEVKREEQRAFERKRKQDEGESIINEDDTSPLNFEHVMNAFINEYINFFKLNPLKGETNGEIDPYFYAKNKIENTYRGITILPFDGVIALGEYDELGFNNYIQSKRIVPILKGDKTNYSVSEVDPKTINLFKKYFEAVRSYNVKRVTTAKEKTDALARIDEKIQKRKALPNLPLLSSNAEKPSYTSSVASSFRNFNTPKKTGGSKTKRNRKQKRNKTKTKRNRNKSKPKQKRSRKTRR